MVLKNTKIVCTIGPTSQSKAVLRKLIESGMNVCRLNFSHGSHEEHLERIDTIKKLRREMNAPIAILLDTKGPEIRTGTFSKPEVMLEEGSRFTITMEDVVGDETKCTVSYKGLIDDVKKNDLILIDDGLVSLRILDIKNPEIHCTVENSGIVKDRKGVNVPGVKINLPAITEKDRSDIEFGILNGIDFIAASFVRKASDVLAIREILEEKAANNIQIISKIENQEGLDNLDEILAVSDGLMVARGDLGVEIPAEDVPIAQKEMIRKCNDLGKPVITATQMLDSMMRNPRPTRAEVTDVANAILDGTDAVMLSGETASGKYPVEAVETMANIAKRTEEEINYQDILRKKGLTKEINITNAISHATCTTAEELGARAIITATSSGQTAKMVSKFKPRCPVIAVTPNDTVQRQLALVWGVKPIKCKDMESTDQVIEEAIDSSLERGFIDSGDLVVITAGVPVGVAGSTNLIKVHVVGEVLAKGIGIGKNSVIGKVCKGNTKEELENVFEDGDIIVAITTDADMNPFIEKASALILEKGGLTSHGAIVGLNLGKPVVVSAAGIYEKVNSGEDITVDTPRGLIYKGQVRVF